MSLGTKRERCKWDQPFEKEGQAISNAMHYPLEACVFMEPYFHMEPYTFDSELPKFWNYALHSTLGHELGHGFDETGTIVTGISSGF